MIYRPGIYLVRWESTNSQVHITTSEVYINKTINTHRELIAFLATVLIEFYCIRQEGNTIKFLREIEYKGREIAILDYTNEREINSLLNNGYKVREFFVDKCILQRVTKHTI